MQLFHVIQRLSALTAAFAITSLIPLSSAFGRPPGKPLNTARAENLYVTEGGQLCRKAKRGRAFEAVYLQRGKYRAITKREARDLGRKRKKKRAELMKMIRACARPPLPAGPLRGSEFCTDADGNGLHDSRDISAFVVIFQERHPSADFNRDGVINSNDVSHFLLAWIDPSRCPSDPESPLPAPTAIPTATPTATPTPTPPAPSIANVECSDGIDNDGDGLIDGEDGAGATEGAAGASLGCLGPNQQESNYNYGFTLHVRSADSRVIYVSAGGSDSNSGLSPDQPVRKLSRAVSLVRNGYPDWILLKRGDVFNDRFADWPHSGRAASEPMVVASYGVSSERPLVLPGSESGFAIGGIARNHLVLAGLHFRATASGTDKAGVRIINDRGRGLLIEDVKSEGFLLGIHLHGKPDQGGFNDVIVRRSIFVDSYSTGGSHSQGAYIDGVNNLLLEECLFDQNGWREDLNVPATIFNHNIYVQDNCGPGVVRNNLSLRGASHGLQLRPGGAVEGNVFARNGLAFTVSRRASTVRRNIVLEGRDISPSTPRGMGIEVLPQPGGVIEDNIISTRIAPSNEGYGIRAGVSSNGVTDYRAAIRGNIIYNWGKHSLSVTGPYSAYNEIRFEDNEVQDQNGGGYLLEHLPSSLDRSRLFFSGNTYFSSRAGTNWFKVGSSVMNLAAWMSASGESNAASGLLSYPDPDRSLGTYNGSLGGEPTFEAFVTAARRLSRGSWDDSYTASPIVAYIRAGFGK